MEVVMQEDSWFLLALIINGNCNAGRFMIFKENFYTKNFKKGSTKYYAMF